MICSTISNLHISAKITLHVSDIQASFKHKVYLFIYLVDYQQDYNNTSNYKHLQSKL
jgi:hypothetical protein